jgi:hypothetical protein
MTNVSKALWIDVLASQQQVSSTTKVHVLLYLHVDLLLAQRAVGCSSRVRLRVVAAMPFTT